MAAVLVVYSEHDLASHDHSGVLGNAPEQRKRLVLAALRTTPTSCTFHACAAAEPDLTLALLAHSQGLVTFLSNAWSEWEALWAAGGEVDYLQPFAVSPNNRSFVPACVRLVFF